MNANFEHLKKIHGGDAAKAESAFREIADLGGFGAVGEGQGQIPVDHAGGLDVAGVLADSNTAVSNKAKDRIAELAGVDREKASKLVDKSEGGQSSKHKMQKTGE